MTGNVVVRILMVSHTSVVSGAELSLLELIGALPPSITVSLAAPRGELADRARQLGITLDVIPNVAMGFKIRPLTMARGIALGAAAAIQLRRTIARRRPDVVHANSIRAGLITVAALAGRPEPIVVHARDVLPRKVAARLIRGLLSARASVIVGNSSYTIEQFAHHRRGAMLRSVHSPVDLGRFQSAPSPTAARRAIGLPEDGLIIGVVGQITPWKGQADALEILRALKRDFPNVILAIVGDVRFRGPGTGYDNDLYLSRLRTAARRIAPDGSVRFLGHRSDIPTVLRALDLLLVPSWLEPFGRVVVEGMASGLPVVATSKGGPAEIIVSGQDGMLLPPQSPALWASALVGLLRDKPARERMGLMGRRRAEDFTLQRHVQSMVTVYGEALSNP